jgi:small-conductance mechanosensitive channel
MEDSAQILQFFRPAGIPTALLIIAGAWFASTLLTNLVHRLGRRFVGRRLLLQQLGTFARFLLYIGSVGACVPLIFALTGEMLLALGGTIAVTLGFAFKDLAASVLAGITILVEKPFQVGDRVTFGGVYGEISTIGLRSVRMVTLDDNLITIPNSKFLTDIVASGNAGELNMLIQMDFFIGLDQDVATAKRICADAITSSRYAYLQKPWSVLVSGVVHQQCYAAQIRAKVYVLDVQFEKALETDVSERVLAAFRREGISPPAVLHRMVAESTAAHGQGQLGPEIPESLLRAPSGPS